MPTFTAQFTQTKTIYGTLDIEAETVREASEQALEIETIGDQNEEIDWQSDEDYDMSLNRISPPLAKSE